MLSPSIQALGDICQLKACPEVGHRLLYAHATDGENPISFTFSVNPEGGHLQDTRNRKRPMPP